MLRVCPIMANGVKSLPRMLGWTSNIPYRSAPITSPVIELTNIRRRLGSDISCPYPIILRLAEKFNSYQGPRLLDAAVAATAAAIDRPGLECWRIAIGATRHKVPMVSLLQLTDAPSLTVTRAQSIGQMNMSTLFGRRSIGQFRIRLARLVGLGW